MDRRGFFKLLGAGVAGIALEQAIPLGRVWSFPSEIVIPKLDFSREAFGLPSALTAHWYGLEQIHALQQQRIKDAMLASIVAQRVDLALVLIEGY